MFFLSINERDQRNDQKVGTQKKLSRGLLKPVFQTKIWKAGAGNLFRAIFFQQDSSAGVNGAATNGIGSQEKGAGGGGSTGGVRSSQVSLSSNPDLDFRYSAIFTEVALYRGRLLAVKRVRKLHIDITRDIKKELKIVSDLFVIRFFINLGR